MTLEDILAELGALRQAQAGQGTAPSPGLPMLQAQDLPPPQMSPSDLGGRAMAPGIVPMARPGTYGGHPAMHHPMMGARPPMQRPGLPMQRPVAPMGSPAPQLGGQMGAQGGWSGAPITQTALSPPGPNGPPPQGSDPMQQMLQQAMLARQAGPPQAPPQAAGSAWSNLQPMGGGTGGPSQQQLAQAMAQRRHPSFHDSRYLFNWLMGR